MRALRVFYMPRIVIKLSATQDIALYLVLVITQVDRWYDMIGYVFVHVLYSTRLVVQVPTYIQSVLYASEYEQRLCLVLDLIYNCPQLYNKLQFRRHELFRNRKLSII